MESKAARLTVCQQTAPLFTRVLRLFLLLFCLDGIPGSVAAATVGFDLVVYICLSEMEKGGEIAAVTETEIENGWQKERRRFGEKKRTR